MTFEELLETYQLQYISEEFIDFHAVQPIQMPEWFQDELHFALEHLGESDKEAFASEFIVVPFLRAVWRRHPKMELFSHVQIQADNMIVIPDYLLSSRSPTGYKALCKPLLLTVEAKDEKFNEGWTQALQQSIVCQKINGAPDVPVFSIVTTTGEAWQFGKLEGTVFKKHPFSVSFYPVEELVGILDALFAACEQAAALG